MNRKEAILDAAIHLFSENGFSATPTSAVAKKAGVAEGLIFHHFKNKNEILLHILNNLFDDYINEVKNTIQKADTGLNAVESVIRYHFRFSEKRLKEILVLVRDFPSDLLQTDSSGKTSISKGLNLMLDLIKESIERGQQDGSIRCLPVEETAFILQGMLNGISRLQLKILDVPEMENISSEVLKFCHRSLSNHR